MTPLQGKGATPLKIVIAACACLLAGSAQAAELAIVHARIYTTPSARALEDGTLIVRDGRIAAVGPAAKLRPAPDAQVIDGRGLTVTAGFWNSHVHLAAPIFDQPGDAAVISGALSGMFTRWGFTTVFDIGSFPGNAIAIRKRIRAGEIEGPNILTVDAPFYPNGGTPIYVRALMAGRPSFEVGATAQGVDRARRELAAGADGVKIFSGAAVGGDVGVLPMPLETAKALVGIAHAAGKPAFAHPSNLAGLNVAIDSGVDILAHTTPDGGAWPADMVTRLKRHRIALIPTLTLWGVELKRGGVPADETARFVALAQDQLRRFAKAGGQVLFGTDVGYTEAVDTAEEYRLMAGSGMTWRQILAALTTAPAERFQARTKGRIMAGMDGDLTLLSADPATEISAFSKVVLTVVGGRIVYRPTSAGR